MLRRFDFWTSRHRPRLAVGVVALLAATFIAAVLELRWLAAAALTLAFLAFIALAVGIRYASGRQGGGGGVGPGIGDGGC